MNKDEIKSCKQLIKKALLVTISSQIKTVTTTVVKTNVQPQFQSVNQ